MENKVIKILKWVGLIGSIITSIAYIIIILILVVGFETQMQSNKVLTIAVLGAIIGLMITLMLRSQGIALAKDTPGIKEIEEEFERSKNKKKKPKQLHTITYHFYISLIKDIFSKVITVAATTYFTISIFIEGNGDFALLGLAIVNILMFFSFGILAMNKAYNYFLNEHINAIIELTKRNNKNLDQEENKNE